MTSSCSRKCPIPASSNHDIELFQKVPYSSQPMVYRKGRLEGFRRNEYGYYDLLHQALNATVGDGFYRRSKVKGIPLSEKK